MAGVASAAIVSGELIIGLDDGQIIRAGYIQGPQGLKGDRGPQGSTGQPGKDGNTLLHGVGTPQFSDGIDGDFFYSTDQVAIYGPKTGGQWGKPVYLRPQDNKSFTLPTGMKAQGGGSGGRAFGMTGGGGMAGGGAATTAPTPTGWRPIIGNDTPHAANRNTVIAEDANGLAFHALVRIQTDHGCRYMEIVASRLSGTSNVADYVIAWEMTLGVDFNVSIIAAVDGANRLILGISADKAIANLRGKVEYL